MLSHPAGALIDATIAVVALRIGALLVSENGRDFEKLAAVLPLRGETRDGETTIHLTVDKRPPHASHAAKPKLPPPPAANKAPPPAKWTRPGEELD